MARHALLIGVSRFEDKRLAELNAPVSDITALEAVLRDPKRGQFDSVTMSPNEDPQSIRDRLAILFYKRDPDDLLLLYYSGHGILGRHNKLFMATPDSNLDYPQAHSISAIDIHELMDQTRAEQQVMMLDCCYSGAFAKGAKSAATVPAVTQDTFFDAGATGRYILMAADAQQFAWDGDSLRDGNSAERHLSRFTAWLVDGLGQGQASPDKEQITMDALFRYVSRRAKAEGSHATPQRYVDRSTGDLVIARNPAAEHNTIPVASKRLEGRIDPPGRTRGPDWRALRAKPPLATRRGLIAAGTVIVGSVAALGYYNFTEGQRMAAAREAAAKILSDKELDDLPVDGKWVVELQYGERPQRQLYEGSRLFWLPENAKLRNADGERRNLISEYFPDVAQREALAKDHGIYVPHEVWISGTKRDKQWGISLQVSTDIPYPGKIDTTSEDRFNIRSTIGRGGLAAFVEADGSLLQYSVKEPWNGLGNGLGCVAAIAVVAYSNGTPQCRSRYFLVMRKGIRYPEDEWFSKKTHRPIFSDPENVLMSRFVFQSKETKGNSTDMFVANFNGDHMCNITANDPVAYDGFYNEKDEQVVAWTKDGQIQFFSTVNGMGPGDIITRPDCLLPEARGIQKLRILQSFSSIEKIRLFCCIN